MPLRRIYTPPTGRAVPVHALGRRSASPRAHRPQYHRRTPSTNDDGTVIESIEDPDSAYRTPAFRQNQFDVQSRQQHDAGRRMHERPSQLIDLTSSAQQATERMRISPSPPPSPYLQRTRQVGGDVEMIDENRPPRHRQMLDIDHHLPPLVPSQRFDHGGRSGLRDRDEYVPSPRMLVHEDRLPMRHDYTTQSLHTQAPVRVASNVGALAPRQVLYEPVDERQPLSRHMRYMPEPPAPAYENPRDRQYYVLDEQGIRRPQPQQHYADVPVRRIVLDATVPMDGVQYSAEPR